MYLIQPLLEPWSGKKALGNGGHSTVFSAEMPSVENKSSASSLPSGGDASRAMTRVVVKCIARKDERQTVVENEVQILMHLWPHSDRHIVPYRAAFHDADNYYIVMQHLPGTTSLTDHLDADDAIPLPALLDSLPHDSPVIAQKLRTLHVIAVDLMLGLERIHAANVAHRDIKPPNVVIKGDAILFCDFGLAVVDDELLPYRETGDYIGKSEKSVKSGAKLHNGGDDVDGTSNGGDITSANGGGGRGGDIKEEMKKDRNGGTSQGAIIGHGEVGSRLFWAPEVSQCKKGLRYDLKDWQRADRFSLGMVLWQLITGCDYYEASRRERERKRGSTVEDEDQKVFEQAFAHGTDDDRKCHEIYELLAGNTPLPVLEPMGPTLARFLERRAPDYIRVLRALISKTPAHRDTVSHATLQPFFIPLPSLTKSSSSSSSSTSSSTSSSSSTSAPLPPPTLSASPFSTYVPSSPSSSTSSPLTVAKPKSKTKPQSYLKPPSPPPVPKALSALSLDTSLNLNPVQATGKHARVPSTSTSLPTSSLLPASESPSVSLVPPPSLPPSPSSSLPQVSTAHSSSDPQPKRLKI